MLLMGVSPKLSDSKVVPLCAGHGSPQQGPLMPFPPNGRPGFGGPGVPMRPGQVPPAMQFMQGGIIYAPPPGMHGAPVMQSSPGVPRPQMFHPGMMTQGPHAVQLMLHMGGPGGPGPLMDGHVGPSAHSSPEQRSRCSGPHSFQGQHRPG